MEVARRVKIQKDGETFKSSSSVKLKSKNFGRFEGTLKD